MLLGCGLRRQPNHGSLAGGDVSTVNEPMELQNLGLDSTNSDYCLAGSLNGFKFTNHRISVVMMPWKQGDDISPLRLSIRSLSAR